MQKDSTEESKGIMITKQHARTKRRIAVD